MTHLGERITDFVFEELPASEMAEAKGHLSECGDCRLEVEQFERTHAFLKTSPDVEPPRPIIFEVEKPRFAWRWSWLVPSAIAAAMILAVFIAAPIQAQWHDSQLTIVFGKASPTPAPAPATVAQNVDYQIQQLHGEVAFWESMEQQTQQDEVKMAGNLQRLAQQRTGATSQQQGGASSPQSGDSSKE